MAELRLLPTDDVGYKCSAITFHASDTKSKGTTQTCTHLSNKEMARPAKAARAPGCPHDRGDLVMLVIN